jgi:hypothetical protein
VDHAPVNFDGAQLREFPASSLSPEGVRGRRVFVGEEPVSQRGCGLALERTLVNFNQRSSLKVDTNEPSERRSHGFDVGFRIRPTIELLYTF